MGTIRAEIACAALWLAAIVPTAGAWAQPAPDRQAVAPQRAIAVGIEADYPPYSLSRQSRDAAGFCVDLTRAVAQVAGLDVEIRVGPWAEIRKSLENGEIDAICGMYFSPERDRVVDFTPPFTVVHHGVFVTGDAEPTREGLVTMRVAVMRGDILHDWALREGLKDRLVETATLPEALRLLQDGKVDCVLGARLPGIHWSRELGFDRIRASDVQLAPMDSCFAVRQGDAALQARLSESLAIVRRSGRLKELTDRWLGADAAAPAAPRAGRTVRIGVLAKQGQQACMSHWGLTADYLSRAVPGYAFRLVPLGFDEVLPAVAEARVDFLLANPGIYVQTEVLHGASRICTLKNSCNGVPMTSFASLVIVRRGREEIRQIRDLQGLRVAAVSANGFGGWQMVLRELIDEGVDPDDLQVTFEGTHDAVVEAVLAGRADAGVIRWNILHDLAATGRARLEEFGWIAFPGQPAREPYPRSTQLYPEWPLARLAHTDDDLAEAVAAALMQMPAESPAARAAGIVGFTVPDNYQSVHECLKALQVSPYEDYGRVSLEAVIEQYWPWLTAGGAALLIVLSCMAVALRLNAALKRTLTEREAAEERESQANRKLMDTNSRLSAAIGRSRRMARKARQIARFRSEFLANMSHEIRTPLTAILGYADLLTDEQTLTEQVKGQLEQILISGRHLQGLINDILDLSKIEAGQLTLTPGGCDVRRLLGEVVDLVRVQAARKHLQVQVDIDPSLSRPLHLDAQRLRQVMINLLGNSVKFTDTGAVCLAARFESDAAGGLLRLTVIDSGIGMDAEMLQRLGKPFTQADASTTRRYGGTGLGLAISFRLVEAMGGRVDVRSRPGMGTTFAIDIPAEVAEAADSPSCDSVREEEAIDRASVCLQGLRALCAEDTAVNRSLLQAILQREGVEVAFAVNGRQALDEADRQPYDLILMDMQMPEMDGYEATAELRRRGCRLPIIALTAHAMAGDRARCLEVGCNDYLSKPIDRKALLQTLARLAPAAASRGAG